MRFPFAPRVERPVRDHGKRPGKSGVKRVRDGDIRCQPNDLAKVTEAAQKLGLTVESAEFEWIPKTLIETDEAVGTEVAELIDALDSHDDVSRVYSNLA